MEYTFRTLMGFEAAKKWSESSKECKVEVWSTIKDKVMPWTVAGVLGAEALFLGASEVKLERKTLAELVKTERSAKRESPVSGPKSFPTPVVGLTLTVGTAAIVIPSGEHTIPFQYTMVLTPAKNTNPAQPQVVYEPGFYLQPLTVKIV